MTTRLIEDRRNNTGKNTGEMVESFGTENYKFNDINTNEYTSNFGGAGDMHGHYSGKQKRDGVGGKNSKSNNYKEEKNRKKRANEKIEREE